MAKKMGDVMSKSTRQRNLNTRSDNPHFNGCTDKFVKDTQARKRKREIEKASRRKNRGK